MPQPKVLDGMRQPRSVRLEDIREHDAAEAARAAAPPVALAPPGVTVYVSSYRKYRVQVTAPQSYISPDGRKQSGGKMIAAQFDEGIYRNNHHDPEVRRLIDEALQRNKYFGPFGSNAHFWLADDQRTRTEAARLKSALDTLRSLPREIVEQHVAALRQGDSEDHIFAEPQTEPAKSGVRPIPPTAAAQ